MHLRLLLALVVAASAQELQQWQQASVKDLHHQYNNIFKHGNRNAASHLWTSFLLERASGISTAQLQYLFSGFCAISGSPVNPGDYNRYLLRLPSVASGQREAGFMHYCCWPCVCDTQDFIRVDTKTITTAEGPKQFRFAVIGNPCDRPTQLTETFVQPFGYRNTNLEREAPEVRCSADGELLGATVSDHGYIIISMFFDAPEEPAAFQAEPQPGRISQLPSSSMTFQDEGEWSGMCTDRAANGFNSGMGEIFRRVAAISPVPDLPQLTAQ